MKYSLMKLRVSLIVIALAVTSFNIASFGATENKKTLADLLNGHSGKAMTILIDKPVAVLKDCTVPTNVTLRFSRGGYLDIASNVLVQFNGGLEAGPYKIIRGSWRMSGIPRVQCIYPEWFFDGKYNDESSDWAPAINQAIRWSAQGAQGVRRVVLQNRRYNVNSTVNLCMEPKKGRIPFGTMLEGQVRSTQYQAGTMLIGNTGEGHAVIEASNVDGVSLRNIGVLRGNNNPSSIGILQVRGTGQWAGDHNYENVYINMESNPASNGKLGTIGVLNVAGEETKWHNLQVWANLPLVLSYTSHLYRVRGDFSGRDLYTVKSIIGATTKGSSNTVFRMTGMGRLISYDYISPCLLINAAGTVDLGTTFMQKRVHRKSAARKIKPGAHRYAVEIWHCDQFKHLGVAEGTQAYMINCGTLQLAEVNMRVAPNPGETKLPIIALYTGNGLHHIIQNSRFVFDVHGSERQLMAFMPRRSKMIPRNQFRLFNNVFKTNQNYNTKTFLDMNLLRQMSNTVLGYKGVELKLGCSSIEKEFSKTVTVSPATHQLVQIDIPNQVEKSKAMALSINVAGMIAKTNARNPSVIDYKVAVNAVVAENGKLTLGKTIVDWSNAVAAEKAIDTSKLKIEAMAGKDGKSIILKLEPHPGSFMYPGCFIQGKVKVLWNGDREGMLFVK